MAKDKLTEYSATNALNDVIGDISVAEGMLPSAVNNALREQMTHLKNFSDGTDAIDGLTVTGNVSVDGGTIKLDGNHPVGTGNVALGDTALDSNVSGLNNTAIGAEALTANTASNNTAVGYQAGYNTSTGLQNVFVGRVAAKNSTTGTYLTAVGDAALELNITGNFNTGIGYSALRSNNNSSNTAVGYQAATNANNSDNTALGARALLLNTSGAFNTAVGSSALYSTSNSSYNTAVGYDCGNSITTGQFNTVIGNRAGKVITTGSTNIIIGNGTETSSSSAGNEINMGNSIAGKGSNTGFISPNGGGVYQGNNSSTWSTTSDERLKKNIVDNNDGLNKINAIRVRNFEYRAEEEVTELDASTVIPISGTQLGVVAQELELVCPDSVKTETTGVKSVNTDKLFWHMLNAVKQLSEKNDALEARIAALEGV